MTVLFIKYGTHFFFSLTSFIFICKFQEAFFFFDYVKSFLTLESPLFTKVPLFAGCVWCGELRSFPPGESDHECPSLTVTLNSNAYTNLFREARVKLHWEITMGFPLVDWRECVCSATHTLLTCFKVLQKTLAFFEAHP